MATTPLAMLTTTATMKAITTMTEATTSTATTKMRRRWSWKKKAFGIASLNSNTLCEIPRLTKNGGG